MDCGKFHVIHRITLLLSIGKSEIKLLHVPGTVGTVSAYFICHMYFVCWVAFILVGEYALGNIFACLLVAGGWLLLAIYYYYYHYLSDNQQ